MAQQTLADRIRDEIERQGRSLYSIHKATGISQSALSRFFSGQTDLSLGSAEKVMAELGFTIRDPKKRGQR